MNAKCLVVRPLITSNSDVGWVATKEQQNESEINQGITKLFTQKWFSIMQTKHFYLTLTPIGVKKTLILVKTRQIQSWRFKLFSNSIFNFVQYVFWKVELKSWYQNFLPKSAGIKATDNADRSPNHRSIWYRP